MPSCAGVSTSQPGIPRSSASASSAISKPRSTRGGEALAPEHLQRHPELQRAELPRELHPALAEVDLRARHAACRAGTPGARRRSRAASAPRAPARSRSRRAGRATCAGRARASRPAPAPPAAPAPARETAAAAPYAPSAWSQSPSRRRSRPAREAGPRRRCWWSPRWRPRRRDRAPPRGPPPPPAAAPRSSRRKPASRGSRRIRSRGRSRAACSPRSMEECVWSEK